LHQESEALLAAIEGRRIGHPAATSHHHVGHVDHQNITQSAFAKAGLPQSTSGSGIITHVTSKHLAWSPSEPSAVSRYGFGLYESGHGISKPFSFTVFQHPARTEYWLGLNGHNWVRIDERTSSAGTGSGTGQGDGMSAPVPGKVIQVHIETGAKIIPGQIMFVLESMKMQFEVKASKEGTVASVMVAAGDQVTAGQTLGEWRL
jgi:hypothetical protein